MNNSLNTFIASYTSKVGASSKLDVSHVINDYVNINYLQSLAWHIIV